MPGFRDPARPNWASISTVATKVLFVEDDNQIRSLLRMHLEDEGYRVIEAESGERGIELFAADPPDLAIVDLLLPGMHGFAVIRHLRERSRMPIVVLTAQSDTHDVVAGLEAGADDYLAKPIAAKELAARLRAHLRRHQATLPTASALNAASAETRSEPATLSVGPLELRPSAGEAYWHGAPLSLTRTEFKILCELAAQPGELLSREALLERVWGYDYLGDGRLVDTQIYRLRTKLEENPSDPRCLVTVRGLGYKLVE